MNLVPRTLNEAAKRSTLPEQKWSPIQEASALSIAPRTDGFTSLKARYNRDFTLSEHDRAVDLSFLAYRVNPMAKRIIDMKVEFMLGQGITIMSEDEKVLEVLQDFWFNEYNNWPYRIYHRLRDLLIYGEWLHQPVIGPKGEVFIASIQPAQIKDTIMDTLNHELIDKVILKKVDHREDVPLEVIQKRLNPLTGGLDNYTGDVFYFGLNRTTDTMRGLGDLVPLVDYIDLYDEILFSRAEKIAAMGHLVWDVKLEGMSQSDIIEYLAQETNLPPKPGTVYAHNERAELKSVVPDLKSDDHAADAAVIKSHIIASAGWPGTFFDDPGTAGRAVGAEMAEPAYKHILNSQSYLKEILKQEMNYVLQVAREAGTLSGDEKDQKYTLSFAKPAIRDIQRVGPAFARLVEALNMIRAQKVVNEDEVRMIFASLVNQLNLSDSPLEMEVPSDADVMPLPKMPPMAQQGAGGPGAGGPANTNNDRASGGNKNPRRQANKGAQASRESYERGDTLRLL